MKITYLNPAGNITAVVEDIVPKEQRAALSREILSSGKAEQVGFQVPPVSGGDCRLEMMGGEFCGNATRSFGFLKAAERYQGGTHTLMVEISGAENPVPVTVNLDEGTAEAQMPLPEKLVEIEIEGERYPMVICPGINHVVAESQKPNAEFVVKALDALQNMAFDAVGVLFLNGEKMTPAVYVRSTDSLVWESSCGSGSVACGWYLAGKLRTEDTEELTFDFLQPGGIIRTTMSCESGGIIRCTIGGSVKIEK